MSEIKIYLVKWFHKFYVGKYQLSVVVRKR